MSLLKTIPVLTLCCVFILPGMNAQADVVGLHGGGEVRGKLLEADKKSPVTAVKTRTGTVITLPGSDIDFVSRRSELMEEYVTRSRQIENTVEAHLELAEWCRSNSLLTQREEQLEQVLDLDPDQPDARKTLGYVRHQGRWTTQEIIMAERGYLRYQGRWVTRQELELIEEHAAKKSAEASWIPRIRKLVAAYVDGTPERKVNLVTEMTKIHEPEAVTALATIMSQHESPDIRMIYVQILKGINGSRPVVPLVESLLLDPSEVIRDAAQRALIPEKQDMAVPVLIAALRHQANPVVSRAAAILGIIKDERAVPALIDALVTTHSYEVDVAKYSSGGIGFTSSPYDRRLFSGLMPPDVEIAARAGQLPYGVNFLPRRGGPPPSIERVTRTQEIKNPDVLAALESITSQNLGFNERDWHVWWALRKG